MKKLFWIGVALQVVIPTLSWQLRDAWLDIPAILYLHTYLPVFGVGIMLCSKRWELCSAWFLALSLSSNHFLLLGVPQHTVAMVLLALATLSAVLALLRLPAPDA